MTGARYRFRSSWLLPGTVPERVFDVVTDLAGYPKWWTTTPPNLFAGPGCRSGSSSGCTGTTRTSARA